MSAPVTRADDLVETIHGIEVADPYRWLEDPASDDTRAWVAAQRQHCEEALAALPERAWFSAVMAQVCASPRLGTPSCREGLYLRQVHDGVRDQAVVLWDTSLDGLLAGGQVLVDPNEWSTDGTVALAALTVAPGGERIAVGRSEAGSDWMKVRLTDLQGRSLDDRELVTKFCTPTWLPDGRSVLYNDYGLGDEVSGADPTKLPGAKLRVHTIGSDDDPVVWDFTATPDLLGWAQVSDDDRWLVYTVSQGTERTNRVWLFGLETRDGRTHVGERLELVEQPRHEWGFVGSRGSELFFTTDDDAPLGRIVAIDTDDWLMREVLPEGADALAGAELAGDVLLVHTMHDASPRLRRVALDGRVLGEVPVDGGALTALHGRADSDEAFLGASTVTQREASWRLDARTGELRPLPAAQGWQAPEFTVERLRATSSDGEQVPFFVVRSQDVPADEPRPTILYGYGGFNVPVFANFRAIWPGWLAAGGTAVIANLRGGGEFGRQWYEQGFKQGKQQVFDDCLAVAQDLVDRGITTSQQLAVHGASNGGLLVGAMVTQRPDLFAAAVPLVGVLDGLRFHRFTIGKAWTSDYGNPDEKADFKAALAWSPLHNVRPGTHYPATLVMTSDHDDRVVPAHSYKFGAALQAAHGGDAPVLVRIEPATGHGGATKPPSVAAAEAADLLSFVAHHTGLVPGAHTTGGQA